jgi:hypothetical protein
VRDPSLFIGCSSEAADVAGALQAGLDGVCEPVIWSQGVFGPSSYTLIDLLAEAERVDFAVVILTPDDVTVSRGESASSARDNAVLELGMFLGSLGRKRVFIVMPKNSSLRLPTDLAGITTLRYNPDRSDHNLDAALGPVVRQIKINIKEEGVKSEQGVDATPSSKVTRPKLAVSEERDELLRELTMLERAAEAQNWTVKTHSDSAFRLVSNTETRYTLALGDPAETRDRLRGYAAQLKAAGLRVSQTVLLPVGAPVPESKARPDRKPRARAPGASPSARAWPAANANKKPAANANKKVAQPSHASPAATSSTTRRRTRTRSSPS